MACLYGLHHFLVPPPNRPEEITLRSVADIGAVGFEVGSEKRKTVSSTRDGNLVWVEGETKFVIEEILYFRDGDNYILHS